MFSPTPNVRPSRRSDNSRINDGKLWAALGFSSSKAPDVAGHSEDGRLFKRVKADLRDIVEADMDWHKTYTQQTSRVLDNVIADIQEKYPELSRPPEALDAMVKYTKLYFQCAHCQFMQRMRRDRAGSLEMKAGYAVDHSSGRDIETAATNTSPALKRLIRVDGDGPSRPSPSCSEETYITSPSTPPSSSANVPGNIVPAALPPADNELFELMRSCDPALKELFARGLDLKTLSLAFHIAELFEERVGPRGDGGRAT